MKNLEKFFQMNGVPQNDTVLPLDSEVNRTLATYAQLPFRESRQDCEEIQREKLLTYRHILDKTGERCIINKLLLSKFVLF